MLASEDKVAFWYERSEPWATKITSSQKETQCQQSLAQKAQPVINMYVNALRKQEQNVFFFKNLKIRQKRIHLDLSIIHASWSLFIYNINKMEN